MEPQKKYPHKILIVEDELSMLGALRDNLISSGFENVLEATDGEEGLALALKESPDLILLDIVMHKMDGLTMLKELRKNPHGKDFKAIVLTNLTANDSIMKRVVTDEPSYYLVKTDYSIEDVMQKVKDTLGVE